ncbi:MAG TPA: FMN-binding protein [Rhodothermales bacterium]|nr:FMN-binding protein [Rhodothermales bacterium]
MRRLRAVLWLAVLAVGLLPYTGFAQPDAAEHVYLTREQALKEVLPTSVRYITEQVTLNAARVRQTEQALNRKLDGNAFDAVLAYDAGGEFVGYAVISEEIGKYRPITFIVGIDPQFRVAKVAIMAYREDRGGEVRTPRFLYQYKGKTARDPIRTNDDILNISGATISVRAINSGVKRVLYLVTDHYRHAPPEPTYQAEKALAEGGAK